MGDSSAANWKERKGIVLVLLVAVVGIWGYAGYTLFSTLGAVGDEAVSERVVPSERPRASPPPVDRSAFVYTGAFRDPFGSAYREAVALSPSSTPRTQPAPEPEPPSVRILGLVNETATVETASGAIRFVRRGDEVDGARVTAVRASGITLRKAGRSYDIPVQ